MNTRESSEFDLLRSITARLIELSRRRQSGADIRWRLQALVVELEFEADREQLLVYKRSHAKKLAAEAAAVA